MVKKVLLVLGSLVVLFLVSNVALGFNPNLLSKLRKSPIGDKALLVAEYIRFAREPLVHPQIEVVDYEFRLFKDGEQLGKWHDPLQDSGGEYWSSLYALVKNTGDVPIHGINVRLKLYRKGVLISEVNPFDSRGESYHRDNTDIYLYIPPDESYVIEPLMLYPPEFDRIELEVEANPFKASQFADGFIPLSVKDLTATAVKLPKKIVLEEPAATVGSEVSDVLNNGCLFRSCGAENYDGGDAQVTFLTADLTNDSNRKVTNIRLDWLVRTISSDTDDLGKSRKSMSSSNVPGLLVFEYDGSLSNSGWTSSGFPNGDLVHLAVLDPGESLKVRVKVFVYSINYLSAFKVREVFHSFAWGETTD